MFDGRLPAQLQDLAPKVVETEEGHEVWHFDGKVFFQVGLNAVVGRKREDWKVEPTALRRDAAGLLRRRRAHPRHGHQRRVGVGQLPVADHRLLRFGVLALQRSRARARGDAGVERLVLRRVVHEASRPHRSDGHHVPRRSRRRPPRRSGATRQRGFTAVTLPEMPHRIGMEPIFSKWWDPIIAACAETGTVVCLHVGSTGVADMPPGSPMVPLGATLFGQLSLSACAEWLWSRYPAQVRRPQDHHERRRDRLGRDAARPAREHRRPLRLRQLLPGRAAPGRGAAPQLLVLDDRRPVDALHARTRSASTTSRSSPTIRTATARGPTPSSVFDDVFGGLTDDEIAKISHENAAALFRHPLPPPGNPHAIGVRR